MTYKELKEKLNELSETQLNLDVIVELEYLDECYKADSLRICSSKHFMLDDGYPVVFVIESRETFLK